MLNVLDKLFFLMHLLLIVFNLFGWIPRKTRLLHLFFVLITLGFWVVVGYWKGFGYCPLTDWHWQVKTQLGETALPASFIKYFVDQMLHINSNPAFIDIMTASALGISLICSLIMNAKAFGFFK